MENRPNYLPLFLRQEKQFQEQSRKRPDSLSFGSNDGAQTILTMVSPMAQSPGFNTRTGMTPLGEFGQIQTPATTPGGSFKRKSQFNLVPSKESNAKSRRVENIVNNDNDFDEWGPEPEKQEWDFSVVNEMLRDTRPKTPPSPEFFENMDENMEHDMENEGFDAFPGPCPASGSSNNWDSPMSIVDSPMSNKAFMGVNANGCQLGSGAGLTIRRRITPAGTPNYTMCDKSIFEFPCFPSNAGSRVEESWE